MPFSRQHESSVYCLYCFRLKANLASVARILVEFGRGLRAARKAKGLTQEELAHRAGSTSTTSVASNGASKIRAYKPSPNWPSHLALHRPRSCRRADSPSPICSDRGRSTTIRPTLSQHASRPALIFPEGFSKRDQPSVHYRPASLGLPGVPHLRHSTR